MSTGPWNSKGLFSMFAKGTIQYFFKGQQMSQETATVRLQDKDSISVLRDGDQQIIDFDRCGPYWLLRGHSTNKSLLYGSRFVLIQH
jgi:hypothetical protein